MVYFYYKNIYKARCTKGLKKCKYKQWIVLFRKMQRCVQTNFHNALTRVIQFVCTHRRSYKTTSFEKEQSIA